MRMKLVTAKLREKLLRNGARPGADPIPVLKLFDPNGAGTWLIAEMNPEAPDRLFGLVQASLASPPEVGVVSLVEMQRYRGRSGIGIERDRCFVGRFPMVCRDRHTIGYGDDGVMPATSGQVSEQTRFPA